LGSNGHDPVLRAPALALGSGAELSADAKRIVKALARVAELHPYANFSISEAGAAASNPTLLRALSEALIAEGVPSGRVAVAMAETPELAAGETLNGAGSAAPKAEAEVVFVIQVGEDESSASANEPSASASGPSADANEPSEATTPPSADVNEPSEATNEPSEAMNLPSEG
jgi:hypothetical protein